MYDKYGHARCRHFLLSVEKLWGSRYLLPATARARKRVVFENVKLLPIRAAGNRVYQFSVLCYKITALEVRP